MGSQYACQRITVKLEEWMGVQSHQGGTVWPSLPAAVMCNFEAKVRICGQ